MSITVLVRTLALIFALVALLTAGARAEDAAAEEPAATDEIQLKNGSRVIGKVTDIRDGVVTLETDFAGTLSVALDQVVTMTTSEDTVLLLADKTVIKEQGIEIRDARLIVGEPGAPVESIALDQILVSDPADWELGKGYNWTGLVSAALTVQRGNTDSDELDFKLESYWRGLDDRFTLKADAELDKSNGVKNADNWSVQGKYDYFISEHTYWGAALSVEADEFKDLNERLVVGPYIGHDFFTDPLFTFTAEAGVSYVKEDFEIAPDNEYPAANWFLRSTSDYLGGDSQLYFEQRGLWDLDDTTDVVIDSTFGLAFPLLWSLEAAAEILWEYDSGAVEGVEELDETYRFRIGYSW